MTNEEFETLFEVGDFIYHNGILCSVESKGICKRYVWDTFDFFCYKVRPLLQGRLLDRQFIFHKGDITESSFGEFTSRSHYKATDDAIIEEISDLLSTFIWLDDEVSVDIRDDHMFISDNDGSVYLTADNAAKLRNILNQYVGGLDDQ